MLLIKLYVKSKLILKIGVLQDCYIRVCDCSIRL